MNRRKVGARRYKDYDESLLNVAVELVKNKNLSSYDAEKQFGIPRRTIINKVKKLHSRRVGTPCKLSTEDENKIVQALILCADYGSPLTCLELRLIVNDYLVKNNKQGIFNNKVPGEKWVRSFLRRHKNSLTMRATINIKRTRVKTVEEYIEFFENLNKSLNGVKPEHILNYDETNLSDSPGTQKCIFKRGTKYPNKILINTRSAISIMFAGTASGMLLPTYVVYKAENLWRNWCINGPPGTRYNKTKSGWFDSQTFDDWFSTIVLPWAQKTPDLKVLIGDNLSSHLNISIIEKCQKNNIRFVFLPPNSTHETQPLDVSFFRPLKRAWRNILLDWKIRNPSANSLDKNTFPYLLSCLIETIKINQARIIENGFRATGIYPLNPEAVLRKLPDYKENYTPQIGFDTALLMFLKETRSPTSTTNLKRTCNKKNKIKPGKSVSTEELTDFQNKTKTNLKLKQNTKIELDASTPIDNHLCAGPSVTTIGPGIPIKVEHNLCISKDRTLFKRSNYNPKVKTSEKPVIISDVLIGSSYTNDTDSISNSSDYSVHDSSCDGPFLRSDSDTETFYGSDNMDNEITVENNISQEVQIGEYVLVKFLAGKAYKYYIGLIIGYNLTEKTYSTKYLRKDAKEMFIWPVVEDISDITLHDIERVLPKPSVGRRGKLKFNVKFDVPIVNIN